MNPLWLVERTDNTWDYDNYDAMVVCAATAAEAMAIQPDDYGWGPEWSTGTPPLTARQIGTTTVYTPGEVVLASYNPG